MWCLGSLRSSLRCGLTTSPGSCPTPILRVYQAGANRPVGFSVVAFSCARPFSKSGPINLSIDLTNPINLVISVFCPVSDHVTREPEPSGSIAKVVTFRAFHGFRSPGSGVVVDDNMPVLLHVGIH